MDYTNVTLVIILSVLVVVIIVLAARSKTTNVLDSPYQFQLLPLTRMIDASVQENLQGDRDLRTLPMSVDLFSDAPNYVLDQGIWGSCTAFSAKYAYYFYMNRPGNTSIDISPAFTYALSRIAGGYGLGDVGSTNADTVGIFARTGVVADTAFPYWAKNIFTPPLSSVTASASHKCTFTSIPFSSNSEVTLNRIKTALQTGPVIVGIKVFKSHMTVSAMQTGVWGMPTNEDLKSGAIGGHSICITGYTSTVFTFHNSWGVYCGLGGLFTLPLAYLTQANSSKPLYATDMWTI
jgi:C1A family cysteine protease